MSNTKPNDKICDNTIAARSLAGRVAVVTGASGGVGRAASIALSQEGVHLCLVGRNSKALAETAAMTQQFSEAESFEIDITVEQNSRSLRLRLERELGRLDILVHCAGVIRQAAMGQSSTEDFDLQYATNVRAPYVLTRELLPLLTAAKGQVVFINSSVGLTASRAEVGQYSATKHALRAIADSLREEVNPKGVSVLTMYLGRTATAMQEAVCRAEGKPYRPETLLQPEDVASLMVQVLKLPPSAEVTDISIRPMIKP